MSGTQFHCFHQSRRGAALVLILCFVVLVAGLMVAFFSRATNERLVSNTNANGIKAEMLADTALDIIVDGFRQEIVSSSTATGTGTTTIYIPSSGSSVVPSRSGTIPNLVCYSSHSDSATRAVNSISTGTSFNGRSVNLARWNTHYLLPLASGTTLGDTTPDSSFTAPDWIVMTRGGALTSGGWDKSLSIASSSNLKYAIGRYAYAVYDEGGLLDVNAAGYPSGATADQYGPKGSLAFADLQQLSLTKPQIDQIVGWRNYAGIQPTGSFPNLVCDNSAASKFTMLVTSGSGTAISNKTYNGNADHFFCDRQQLIKFILALGTSATEQTQLQSALLCLGTFSREVNGPTWGTSNYPYYGAAASVSNYYAGGQFSASLSSGDVSCNPCILYPKVTAPFTRADGSTAVKGEPLIKYRFPLEKLALLEKMQGVSTLTAQDKDDIARYFGLDPVSDSVGYYRHWSYPTASTKYTHTNSAGIMTLDEVTGQNREPDFFELLQAGILNGSLGKTCNGKADITPQYGSSFDDPDSKKTLQILRIGANIIDQWDADNYPTTISCASGQSVYGIEDLPYINKFLFSITGPGTYGAPFNQQYNIAYGFQLWNPHRALTSNTGAYPSQLQISPLYVSDKPSYSDSYQVGLVIRRASDKKYFSWYWNGAKQAWFTGGQTEYFNDLNPSHGVMSVSFSDPANNFREPAIGGTIALPVMNGFPSDTVLSGTQTYSNLSISGNNIGFWFYIKSSTVYRIQFFDSAGNPHTYSTFVGLDDSTTPTPTAYVQTPWLPTADTKTAQWYSCPKSDPRTSRFRSGQSTEHDAGSANSGVTPNSSTVYSKISSQFPFISDVSGNYRVDRWAVNDPASQMSTLSNPCYPDLDGATRPGDAYYSATTTYVSPLFTSGTAARPLVLNRPFRSVGELGYVFRDMPWKTLDLFSSSSADAALLDLFSLNQNQPVLQGRIDPNTRNEAVLSAMIAGAMQRLADGTVISKENADTLAKEMVKLSKAAPFTNRAELVTRLMRDSVLSNISDIKSEREALVRALADCSNMRTWNLLIDLVAQSGKYPPSANTASNPLDCFVVEGERHYWLHVAIDRYTGQVIDRQIEVVRE
jgi:hypothetical protein